MKYLMLLLLTSCGGIKWNPDFLVGDHKNFGVVNERGEYIYADEAAFDGLACLTESKVKELAEILIRAKLPRAMKKKLINEVNYQDAKLQKLFR